MILCDIRLPVNCLSENVVHLQSVMIKELGETVKVLSQDIDVLKRKLENLAEQELREAQLTNAVHPRSKAYQRDVTQPS